MNTKINFLGKEFKNPVIMASGTFGFSREYSALYDISVLGGFCTKAITKEKREGNDSPRIAETNMGILNSVGLQNPGVEKFLQEEAEYLSSIDTVKIANVAGYDIEDYCFTASKIDSLKAIDMIELNISCPNVKKGGITFGTEPKSVEEITKAVKKCIKKPLIVKLSPNVTSITDIALSAERGGADAISLINTLGGMAINYKTKKPILKNVFGGLSGPCIKPVALKMVHQVYKAVKIPIIGMGGIQSAEDILEFMIAGASLIQIGTANFYDPLIGKRIVNDLTNLLKECKIDNITDLIGSLSY